MYGGPIGAYALMVAAGKVAICSGGILKKDDWHFNRCRVLTANGPMVLTLPMSKGSKSVREIGLSAHGHWQRLHRGTFFSAYGRTPYFEHIDDDLYAIIDGDYSTVKDFDVAIMRLMIEFMRLPVTIEESDGQPSNHNSINSIDSIEYWQVWRERFGFTGGMSIFDLAFNEGPMAIHTLRKFNERRCQ